MLNIWSSYRIFLDSSVLSFFLSNKSLTCSITVIIKRDGDKKNISCNSSFVYIKSIAINEWNECQNRYYQLSWLMFFFLSECCDRSRRPLFLTINTVLAFISTFFYISCGTLYSLCPDIINKLKSDLQIKTNRYKARQAKVFDWDIPIFVIFEAFRLFFEY